MDSGQSTSSHPRRARNAPTYREPDLTQYGISSGSSDKSSGEEFSERDEEEEVEEEEEEEEDEEEDLSSQEVYDKFKVSAGAVSRSMKKLLVECKPEKRIAELCKIGDDYMTKESQIFLQKKKNRKSGMLVGIAFPTCISVNERLCSVAPSSHDDTPLKHDDILKIEMAFHTDGYIASLAHTHVVSEKITGKTADVLAAADTARDWSTKVIKIGMTELESSMHVMDSYGCKLLKFECRSHQRSREEILSDDAAFKLDKAYSMDIIVGTEDTEFEEENISDVFKTIPHTEIKGRNIPKLLLTINEKIPQMAFSIRSLEGLEDHDIPTIISLRESEILQPYPILRTKDVGVLVARLKFTFFLTKGGPQDKTSIRLQKLHRKKSERKGREIESMAYCGKTPIGTNASDIVPSINSISWVAQKNVKKKKDQQTMLVCTGSFGTYVFEKRKVNEGTIEDLELGWTKREVSNLCGSICLCNPYEKTIVAIGVIDEYNRANIYMLDINDGNPAQLIYLNQAVFGLNSLSWSSNGLHLLCIFNDTKGFIVLIREKKKLIKSNSLYTEFSDLQRNQKANHFGVFHPRMMLVFIATSEDEIGAFEYVGNQEKSAAAYWRRHGAAPRPSHENGFCGIAISADGEYLICPRLDGSILGLKLDCIRLTEQQSPFYEVVFNQQFDAPTPFNCSTLYPPYFVTLCKGQIIKCHGYIRRLTFICDNQKDIACTNDCRDFSALSWQNQLLALGGEDGFLHFWMLSTKDFVPFAVKKRSILSEKLFYTKKQLLLGSVQSLRQKCTEIKADLQSQMKAIESKLDAYGGESSQRVDLLEGQIEKAVDLGSEMLFRLHQSEEPLPAAEAREFVEQILGFLTTIDD